MENATSSGIDGGRSGAGSGGLYTPRPVEVLRRGRELERVGGLGVESVRDEWLIEDRWWSGRPLRRHYLELILTGGRCAVVFCDLETGSWFEQR